MCLNGILTLQIGYIFLWEECKVKHRILILTTVGGFLPKFLEGHIQILKSLDAEIYYASNFSEPAYEYDAAYFGEHDIRTIPLPIEKSPYQFRKNARALKRLVRFIREHQIDAVHCHNPVGGILGRLAGLLAGKRVKVIYTAHGFHFYKGAPVKNWVVYYGAERLMAYCTDSLVTINREDYEKARGFRLKKGGRLFRIPGVGFDLEKYACRPRDRADARKILGVEEGEFCLVTGALLHPDKSYETILYALTHLSDIPFRYVICGEGPYRQQLEELTDRLGLRDRVTFLGFRRDMDFLLQGADVFVFPSVREGLGMAALEAMACGIPVIAADNRGTREYMEHGRNGIVCPAGDERAFARAIRELWENPDRRAAMGENALRDARPFGAEQAAASIREVYEKSLA